MPPKRTPNAPRTPATPRIPALEEPGSAGTAGSGRLMGPPSAPPSGRRLAAPLGPPRCKFSIPQSFFRITVANIK